MLASARVGEQLLASVNFVPKYLRDAIVVLFLCAFAAVGLRGIAYTGKKLPRIDGTGPQCCTDASLKLFFQTSGCSKILNGCLGRISPGNPVVIFFPDNNPDANLASQIISSALWPRPVLFAPSNAQTLPRIFNTIQKYPIGSMFFCCITPPPLPGNQAILPRLYFVPVPRPEQ